MNDETIIDGGNVTAVEAPETPTESVEPVELTPEQIEEQKRAEEAEHKRKTGSQRAREKAERLERENQALRDALARGTHKAPEPEEPAYVPKTADGRPDPEDPKFKSYEDYLDALTDWKVERRLQTATEQAETRRLNDQYSSIVHATLQAHPDFEHIANELAEDGIEPSEPMKRVVMASEAGHELLYHLAKNPEVTARLAKMPEQVQYLQLGVMLGQLQAGEAKPKPVTKPSSAPAPPRPVKATGVASVDPSKLSDADWLKEQMRKR